MNKINRYIAIQFLTNVVAMFVILYLFIITIDVFFNLNRFSGAASRAMEADGGEAGGLAQLFVTIKLVANLWWPRMLLLFGHLSGVVLIAAAGFTCTQLVRHRELVALLASGVGLHRLAAPFLVIGGVVAGGQIALQELAVPRIAHLLIRDVGDSASTTIDSFRLSPVSDKDSRVLTAARYDDGTRTLTSPTFFLRDDQGRLLQTIRADSAQWDGAAWALTNGTSRREGQGALSDSAGTPLIEVVGRVESPLDPARLLLHYRSEFAQHLSWGQLGEMIEGGGISRETARRLDRIRWGRPASALCNLLTLFAVLPIFLVRMPQPMVKPTMRAAPIAGLGLGAAVVAATVALPGLPAAVGAFVPALILAPVALAVFSGMKS